MPLGGILTVGAAAGGVASGIGQFIGAAHDEKKAKQELSRLKPAYYKIQDEYYQNKNLAAEQAQGGLPAATKDYLTEQNDRGLGTAIGAISQTGGSPNDYADLFDSYNKSIRATAAQDAAAQVDNIKNFMAVNKDLAGQKTTQWTINEYQPYQNKLKEITERIKAAKLNKSGAIQTAIGSVGAAGTALSNTGLMPNGTPPAASNTAPATSFQQLQERAIGGKVQMPTFDPAKQTFQPYRSNWQQQQEADFAAAQGYQDYMTPMGGE